MNHLQVVLEEVTLGVGRVDAPPVVDKHIEDTEEGDEETSAPLCLEPNGDHDASTETDDRDEDSSERPASLEDESDEEEDEEDSAGELEAGLLVRRNDSGACSTTYYLRRSVSLMDGIPAKSFFLFANESERTINRPPTTLRFRRKKDRSKRSP